jgi:hypothetical protein
MKPKPPSEFQEQCALCDWLDLKRVLYYAIPNGGSRHPLEAVNLKRSGVKAGVPDICIPVPRKDYCGLYIELKSKNGKPTLNQISWVADLNTAGYKAVFCYGFDEAKKVVEEYLG